METLHKKVKQNFPLKYFLGDNENAIKIQVLVTMIAYQLMKVLQHKSKSKLAFSNVVTTVRITICSYTDIVMLLNNPKAEWEAYQKLRWEMQAASKEKYRQLDLFDDIYGFALKTKVPILIISRLQVENQRILF